MAKMKELYLELQNQYGQELEDLPEGFCMDEYLKQKAQELDEEKKK